MSQKNDNIPQDDNMENTYKYMLDTLNRLDSTVMQLNVTVAELRVFMEQSKRDVDGLYSRIRKVELDMTYRKGMYVVICSIGASVGGLVVWFVQRMVEKAL